MASCFLLASGLVLPPTFLRVCLTSTWALSPEPPAPSWSTHVETLGLQPEALVTPCQG